MIQITSVRFRKLVSSGNYEHVALEAEACVPDGADPDAIREELAKWVEVGLRHETELVRLNRQLHQMYDDVHAVQQHRDRLDLELKSFRSKLRVADDFIAAAKKAGVTVPDALISDEIPF